MDSVFALLHIVGWIQRIKIQIREVDGADKIAGEELEGAQEKAPAARLLRSTGLSSGGGESAGETSPILSNEVAKETQSEARKK